MESKRKEAFSIRPRPLFAVGVPVLMVSQIIKWEVRGTTAGVVVLFFFYTDVV